MGERKSDLPDLVIGEYSLPLQNEMEHNWSKY